MIVCKDGELHFKGYGEEIAPEMGCIMQYFFENATEKEIVVALETFKDGLSNKAKVNFITALTMVMK